MTETAATSRRDRLRAETLAEIKDRTWALMAQSGTEALSLRAVARQMGMAPSALYRYFPSRNDLLTALIVDAFSSLAEVVDAAYQAAQPPGGGTELDVFVAVCREYRRWARANRTEWMLIFSSAIPDYNGTEATKQASMRVTDVLTQVMADAVNAGCVDLERLDHEVDESMRPGLEQWSANGGLGLPPAALAAALWCYAALHGAIALDLNEHLPPPLLDSEALFETSLRAVLEHIAVRPG